jgi:hypothetical protein
MAVMLKVSVSKKTYAIIIFASIINPLWYLTQGYSPKHDSFLQAQIINYISESLINTNQYPIWLPQVSNGIPIILYDLIFIGPLEGISILLATLIGIKTLNITYGIYLIVSNIFVSVFFLKILNEINGKNHENVIITSLLTLTLQPLYQFSYNYKVIILFIFVAYFLIIYTKHPKIKNFINVVFSLLIMGIAGQTIYHTVMIFYIIFPIILYVTVKHWKNIFRLSEIKFNIKISNVILYLSILTGTLLIINYYFLIKKYFEILIPGRNKNATTSYENAINHGGFNGIEKFLTIFGKSQIDLNLVGFTGCVISIYVLLEIFRNYREINRNPIFTYTIILISWTVILTLPVPFVIKFMHQYMPGFAYVRHLSYFSTILIPLILILFSIVIAKAKSNINLLLSTLIGTIIQFVINSKLELLIINIFIFTIILIIIRVRTKSEILFIVFCTTYIAQWITTTNLEYLSKNDYTKSYSIESEIRTDPASSLSLKSIRSNENIGTLSTVITLLNNEDYCLNYSNWQNPNYLRVDFILKTIYENHPEIWNESSNLSTNSLESCGEKKIFITNDVDRKKEYQDFYKIGSYSRELNVETTKGNEKLEYDLIYQDAFFPFWRVEVDGASRVITEENGYKKISRVVNGNNVKFYINYSEIFIFYAFKILNLLSFVFFVSKIFNYSNKQGRLLNRNLN